MGGRMLNTLRGSWRHLGYVMISRGGEALWCALVVSHRGFSMGHRGFKMGHRGFRMGHPSMKSDALVAPVV